MLCIDLYQCVSNSYPSTCIASNPLLSCAYFTSTSLAQRRRASDTQNQSHFSTFPDITTGVIKYAITQALHLQLSLGGAEHELPNLNFRLMRCWS